MPEPKRMQPAAACTASGRYRKARALSRGCRWPPGGSRPSALKLYSLKVSSFQVPL